MEKTLVVLVTSFLAAFLWLLYMADPGGSSKWGLFHSNHPGLKGVIFDLEQDPYIFVLHGFIFYKRCPVRRQKQLAASKVWLLSSRSSQGDVKIKGLQRARGHRVDVVVLIRYHIHWEGKARISVSGFDRASKEMVTEHLSQYGDSYCSKVVFLGPVHEVIIQASATGIESFVIIDELKVAVGSKRFNALEEQQCL